MKKILSALLFIYFSQVISLSVHAGSDGSLEIQDKENSIEENMQVKDCFETVNRGIFAFNLF